MRIALLTTDTPHHVHFARRVAVRHPLAAILAETRVATPPFPTAHPFEERRDAHERAVLLEGPGDTLEAVAPTTRVASVNAPQAIEVLGRLSPDVCIVFGTGILHDAAIHAASIACLNLHGGDPERYRGLDSHLWAIYHRDFTALVTALHHVDAGIDTGDLVATAPLPVTRDTGIHELRALTTGRCVDLVVDALDAVERDGAAPRTPQRTAGRYYSFMPAVLKDTCVEHFARHAETL